MEKLLKAIRVSSTDDTINTAISDPAGGSESYPSHFSQREESFVPIEEQLSVPSFKIHHDVENPEPDPEYSDLIRPLISTIHTHVPGILNGLKYFFDPSEILKPCFYRFYRIEQSLYMYLLRVDLIYKPSDCTREGTVGNDRTPPYSTKKLFLEADFLPIERVVKTDEEVESVVLKQVIQQIWKGESGRGYRAQGVWIDQDLTKFFSSVFTRADITRYPYYPFTCKYRTFSHTPAFFTSEKRKAMLPLYHRASSFIKPVAGQIEALMRRHPFSKDLSLLQELRSKVPDKWLDAWNGLNVSVYLNEKEMREYVLEF